ncbi:aldehyde dehydrogenase [Clostridium grantii]|uniref:Aldehyde dehydrogenase n=1 Tax=Clostridium grantii DSM 8605 TaxID=1121316 RepID=A0A1M5TQ20_9CLOT|nr:aldehyde dehydrogenase [Clostridium grantii]SHH52493.1 aldehyde dehydrogenase (NAD+) [Clostridium grantii DSM 8605]
MINYAEIIEEHKKYYYTSKTKGIEYRIQRLSELKNSIRNNEDKIADALYMDLGKSKHEAITTEIGFTLNEIKTVMKNLKKWSKIKHSKTNLINFLGKSYTVREPFGVTLIMGPWNYPFQLVMAPLIGAIAGGNCSVIKPSELAPNTARVIEEIINETFKQNYISVVQGGIPETEALLEQRFDKIFFTGSTKVGSIVMNKAARHLTPVVLELGGKSPTIVDNTADLTKAAKRIIFGKGINSGQTCVAPDYVLVHESVKKDFYETFGKVVKNLYGEDLLTNEDYGRMINEKNYQRVKSYIGDGKLVYGGKTNDDKLHIDLTLIEVENIDKPIMKDEIFGPILPVISYSTYEELIEIIRRNPDPLAFYVFSENQKFVNRLIQDVPFGGGCINDTIMHLTNEHLPFGGRGTSGTGNYHGRYSFEAFTHEKSVLKSATFFDMPLKYPPYGGKALAFIKRLMY